VEFKHSTDPQLSPEWIALRVGKVTASRLKDWLAVSKRPNKDGVHTPLKARADYEQELAFEKRFNRPFSRFATRAMEEGQMAEEFVKTEYAANSAQRVSPGGAFYNDVFVASPDSLVGEDGLLEVKWLYDTSYTDVLVNGVPEEYMLQMQGQLWASDRKWCDFVAGNGNTSTYIIIRVERDEEIIGRIKDSLADGVKLPELEGFMVSEFSTPPPFGKQEQLSQGGW